VAAAAASNEDDDNSSLNAGTKDLLELIYPWAKSNRVVVADSHFASVQTARELYKVGMRFIGCVKTATKGFPMKLLGDVQLPGRGSHFGMFHKSTEEELPDLLAFTWCDKERRSFISSCSNLRQAAPILRSRMRQIAPVETDEAPEMQHIAINLPTCGKLYYDNCGRIDQHNRKRQDDLKLERKIGTNDWAKRVNFTIEAMVVVDAYLAYMDCTQPDVDHHNKETFDEFIHKLADEMIEWDNPSCRSNATPGKRKAAPRSSDIVHLTPTKRLRAQASPFASSASTASSSDGSSKALHPLWCKLPGCTHRTSTVCSHCSRDGKEMHFCNPYSKGNRKCFQQHCETHHANETVLLSSRIH